MDDGGRKKLLLMGKSGSGKTSMRSIIFANFLARETRSLNPTLEVQNSNVRFLGNMVVNLWDCGGQDAFYESYFASQREHIFRNVAVLIYVFDVASREVARDLEYYASTIAALRELSPEAHVVVLLHKMDLLPADARDAVFAERSELIKADSAGLKLMIFRTTIWDETLYQAWSSVVNLLIPNIGVLEASLARTTAACDADEIVLFERATFLVIAHSTRRPHADLHRFEKISNVVKQFKLTCGRGSGQFAGLRVGNSSFCVCLQALTANTYVLISFPSEREVEAGLVNIELAKPHFEKLIASVT
jgi:Ras-related GTP-binding protein A/B